MNIQIPDFALVLLIGCSGSGKSTFAARHFLPTEVLSSDDFRGWVADDPNTLDANDDAFSALHHLAHIRLRRRRLTVIDATNVQQGARRTLIDIALEHDALLVTLVFDLPERLLHERNKARTDRDLGPHVVRTQMRNLRQSIRAIRKEGFHHVHVLTSQDQVDSVQLTRGPLWTDRRSESGPFDIIGDVHGCFDELTTLLSRLGYEPGADGVLAHPAGRRAVFVGDLVDRGPQSAAVARLVMGMCAAGTGLCVPGNHDVKLKRALEGRAVTVAHGLAESLNDIERLPDEERDSFKRDYCAFVDKLVSHMWLDGGKLAVSHAGVKEDFIGRASRRVREFCLYGETTGEVDEFGLPVRLNWAADYRGRTTVVYGHVPVPNAEWLNNTIDLDTGCVFGGKLTALRWPERELVSVDALQQYAKPIRPVGYPSEVSEPPPTIEVILNQLAQMREAHAQFASRLHLKAVMEEKDGGVELTGECASQLERCQKAIDELDTLSGALAKLRTKERSEQILESTRLVTLLVEPLGVSIDFDEGELDSRLFTLMEGDAANRGSVVEAVTSKNELQALLQVEKTALANATDEQLPAIQRRIDRITPLAQEAAEQVERLKVAIVDQEFAARSTVAFMLAAKGIKAYRDHLINLDKPKEMTHADVLSAQWQADELLRAEDVLGKRLIETRLSGNVLIPAENAAAAFEVMSRFAVEPRWLVYLPPTMSPCETSSEEGFLERPEEAFAHFRELGIEKVVCQTKHMGSRAIAVVCRDEQSARRRFGAQAGIGEFYTRTGRRFFDNSEWHKAVLERIARACTQSGLWDTLSSDWVCLDGELMPWNAKAQGLIREQYAPVGAAAVSATLAQVGAMEGALARGDLSAEARSDLEACLARAKQRCESAAKYVQSYQRYCWPVDSLERLRFAPFHLLAWEGGVGFDQDHRWHLNHLNGLTGKDPLLAATEAKWVSLDDPDSEARAITWWLEETAKGAEGMVVKPAHFTQQGKHGLVQPALKVRGKEYLRIIYGPEYDDPVNLKRLRKRSLGGKRRLASREFALGVEGLERFVRKEPLRRVHECALGVLALESEPVDPRL